MTQEGEGAFVSSLLWFPPAVTASCCVLYEGPEKMSFPGMAQVRLRVCLGNEIITESPAEGSDKPAMEGHASCIHITGREGGFFSSHATDLSPREATSWVRELIPGCSTAPRDTRILSQKSGAKGAI